MDVGDIKYCYLIRF